MFRLPFLFIGSSMIGFVLFQIFSLITLADWFQVGLRGPTGWFQVHLFVLGWATMLAMGAVYQLISVILQSELYSEKLGYVHYGVFTIGLVGLLYGFWSFRIEWIALFAFLTMIGIFLFAWNVGVTLLRAKRWNTITISAACAIFYLVLTALLGLAMGLNFYKGYWNSYHNNFFGAHIWLGTTGWFGLLITGFSYKLLPMFYLAHHYPEKLQKVTVVIWNLGVLFGAGAFLFGGGYWSIWTALLIMTAAIVIYTVHLMQIKKYRVKRNPGRGILMSVYCSQVLALCAIGMTIYTLIFPDQLLSAKSVLLAGWIYLGGWVSFTILCYASKIVPFLWWTHKYGPHAGKQGTPLMADMLNEKRVQGGLLLVAVCLLILYAGITFDLKVVMAMSGIAFSIVSILYMGLIGRVFAQ